MRARITSGFAAALRGRAAWGIWLLLACEASRAAVHVTDPPDQVFRWAPMRAAARSLVISLGASNYLAFDAERQRSHTVWRGAGLDLLGPPYSGAKEPFICKYRGETLWTTPPVAAWQTNASSTWRPGTPDADRLSSWVVRDRRVVLEYQVEVADGRRVSVREAPRIERRGGREWIVREFHVPARESALWFLAHAGVGRSEVHERGPVRAASLERAEGVLMAVLEGGAGVSWEVEEREIEYPIEWVTETGTEAGWQVEMFRGRENRLQVFVPSSRGALDFTVRTAVLARTDDIAALLDAWPSRRDLEVVATESGPKAEVIPSEPKPRRAQSGDRSYVIEHFPVPEKAEFLVGGMDWLPNEDLAVCTWPGEVYVVEGVQGEPAGARYRRFARGLNEPLGLKVHGGEVYVVHKAGLVRLRDEDGDGEADRFDQLSAAWGYSGNYHSFAFGPAIDAAGGIYVFLTGQRGRWDMPYVGWCVRIDGKDYRAEGFCSGLRVPNGWALVGASQELFVTDNQGNWIGACKLNHLREGRFYGYPSGTPAKENLRRLGSEVEAPAVWFPRRLAPSASDIAEIRDDRFGPFQGQLVVGDFQNAILMRVALEKVGSRWQGAVWPFASGFGSGVNRLNYGPDGKLYVGGCKRTWSSSGPWEGSLDRVSFTGSQPFEVRDVGLRANGFRLRLTGRADREMAEDVENYSVSQFTYEYHEAYGSAEIDHAGIENRSTDLPVRRAVLSADGLTIELEIEGLREGYVTEVRCPDLASAAGEPLRQGEFYYTIASAVPSGATREVP